MDPKNETTRDGEVAARMANRYFNESTQVTIDGMTSTEAKRHFCKMTILKAALNLSSAVPDDWEADIADVIAMIKEAKAQTPSP